MRKKLFRIVIVICLIVGIEKAALVWARLMSEGSAAGKPRSDLDMIVAAVAETNKCVILTDNEKHFSGLDVLNPLRKPP